MGCTDIIGRLVVSLSNVRVKVASQCYSVLSPIFSLFELLVHCNASGNTNSELCLDWYSVSCKALTVPVSLSFFPPGTFHISHLWAAICKSLRFCCLPAWCTTERERSGPGRRSSLGPVCWNFSLEADLSIRVRNGRELLPGTLLISCRRDIVCKGLWESSNRKKQVNERFHKSTLSYYWRMPSRCNASREQEWHREGNILY